METIGTVLMAWFCTWSSLHYANNPIEGRTQREQWSVMANYRKVLADIPILRLDAACRSLTQNVRFFQNQPTFGRNSRATSTSFDVGDPMAPHMLVCAHDLGSSSNT